MRKDASTIQAMFGEIAPRYDLLNHLLSLNVDRLWRRQVTALARPDGPVLDVCTGTGDLAATCAAATAGPVVGLDFCAPMLRRGRDKKGCRAVRFVRGDVLRLPFPDASFDVVCVAFGIRNVSDLDQGLAELARVARPGGRIAVLEFSIPRRRWMRVLYGFYFGRVLPLLGNLISRSGAYSYLTRSVMEWTGREELAERMRRAGCATVAVRPLSFGIAAVHLGIKAPENHA